MITEITNYDSFVSELLKAGFSVASGGNDEGIFALVEFSWDNQPSDSKVRWHTGDEDTDPWEWRIRVLDERKDIAYSKLFFKKAGYITKEWYPYFLAARRGNRLFADEYADGKISSHAKRIYDVIAEHGSLPLHGIKQLAGFGKEDKSKFDAALTDLQMRMYLTMCGKQQKLSQKGEEYGWSSTVFCRTEDFFGEEVFESAAKLTADEAVEKITRQIRLLNPSANEKKISKFIKG